MQKMSTSGGVNSTDNSLKSVNTSSSTQIPKLLHTPANQNSHQPTSTSPPLPESGSNPIKLEKGTPRLTPPLPPISHPRVRSTSAHQVSWNQIPLPNITSSQNNSPSPSPPLPPSKDTSAEIMNTTSQGELVKNNFDFPENAIEEFLQQKDENKFTAHDPFVAKPPKFEFPRALLFSLFGIPVLSLGLVFICNGLDILLGGEYSIPELVLSLTAPDVRPSLSKKIMTPLLLYLAFAFGMLLTAIGLVLELSSSKFTGAVAAVFFRDWKVLMSVILVVLLNLWGQVVFMTCTDGGYHPRASIVITVGATIYLMSCTMPFTNYLFFFLDPQKVVTSIVSHGLKGVMQSVKDPNGHHVDLYQHKAVSATEHLTAAANRAIRKKDKNIAAKSVDALCSFAIHYGRYKSEMFDHWYYIPDWIRQSPDFLSLSDEAILNVRTKRTWLEWKIHRQFLDLFNIAIGVLKEVCYHVAMNTRVLAEAAVVERGDVAVLDMSILFFNSYLRFAINKSNRIVIFMVLYQYRMLGEYIIEYSKHLKSDDNLDSKSSKATLANALEERVLQIAKYMRYYAFICLANPALSFMVEVICHDIRVMCELAFKVESGLHDRLLKVFLTVYDKSDARGSKSLRGVRIAQICLATFYLANNKPGIARKIYEDFLDEPKERLVGLFNELQNVTTREFWEVSERGVNFTYISQEQKDQLGRFFSWFKKGAGEDVELNAKGKSAVKRRVQDLIVTDL